MSNLLSITAGIDEAGRGPLAGPVVAATCILPKSIKIPSFSCDSKALEPEEREEAFVWVQKYCTVGIGLSSASYIDRFGILAATERAMQQAVTMIACSLKPTYLLVDGRDKFWFDYPHSSVIHGDALEPCISAASIVAKVTRDHLMREADRVFPEYGFAGHKGYGTEEHYEMIRRFGACRIHRKSFLKKENAYP